MWRALHEIIYTNTCNDTSNCVSNLCRNSECPSNNQFSRANQHFPRAHHYRSVQFILHSSSMIQLNACERLWMIHIKSNWCLLLMISQSKLIENNLTNLSLRCNICDTFTHNKKDLTHFSVKFFKGSKKSLSIQCAKIS